MEKILSRTIKQQNTSIILISGIVLLMHFVLFKLMMQLNSKYDLLEVTMPAMQIEFFQQSAKPEEKIPQQAKKIKSVVPPKPLVNTVKQVQEIKKIEQPIEKVIKPLKPIEQKPILTAKQNVKSNYIVEQQITSPPVVQKTVKVDESKEIKQEQALVKPSINNDIDNKSDKLLNTNSGKNTSTDAKDSSPKAGINSNSQYMGGKPEYPSYAEENNIEGTVVLNVLVGSDGKAKKVILAKSSGESVLDNSALKHVQGAGNKFKPMIKDGNPVEGWITFAIKFKLD